MKKIILFFIVCFPLTFFAQSTSWSDDFSAGLNAWIGDTADFNTNNDILNLNAPKEAATKYITRSSNISKEATWEFWVKLDFNPSGNNYCDIYIMSPSPNLTDGYFVRLGSANDNISLFNSNNPKTAIISGFNKVLNHNSSTTRIKVTRDKNNELTLYADTLGNYDYAVIGTVIDSTFETSNSFGIKCVFIKANNKKFHFDDIKVSGIAVVDNDPPQITGINPLSNYELELCFDEAISCYNESSFSVNNGIGNPESITTNGNCIKLIFVNQFDPQTTYTLTYNNICDLSNNMMPTGTLSFKTNNMFSVLITEIMATPTPSEGFLPSADYVEIYNNTQKPIDLTGWTIALTATGTPKSFPKQTINSGEYIILCPDANKKEFEDYSGTKVISFSSFAVTNGGSTITLCNKNGDIVHSVVYSPDFYKTSHKKAGGWSLEMKDINNPCEWENNWAECIHGLGGTPGKENSVAVENNDINSPYPIIIDPTSEYTIDIYFNEQIDKIQLENAINYETELGIKTAITKDGITTFDIVTISLAKPMIANEVYFLNILTTLTDCAGNKVTLRDSLPYGIISNEINPNDIIINEILAESKTDFYDFIEIYNRSDKVLDLKGLCFLKVTSKPTLQPITTSGDNKFSKLILPGQYCVIGKRTHLLSDHYNTEAKNLFSTNFDLNMGAEATIKLVRKSDETIIDAVSYTSKWHYPLLVSTQGVSLERLCYDRPSDDQSNWHSAAETAGFATQGYKNSQFSCTKIEEDNIFTLESEVFSPDNDGFNDNLSIGVQLPEAGYTANITVYNSQGFFIKQIVNNQLFGMENYCSWDGKNGNNEICPIGIYILYGEFFNVNTGEKIAKKKAFVLSKKL